MHCPYLVSVIGENTKRHLKRIAVILAVLVVIGILGFWLFSMLVIDFAAKNGNMPMVKMCISISIK
jgi:4-amino-4-deoxy-L-arabinose transferase-like glycosyltransferase